MIAKLRGTVDTVGEDWLIVDVHGVGYLVSCSSRSLGRLAVGAAVSLLVETHVREDAILLYGFLDQGERDWFRLLTTVQGVGSRVALAILSILAPDQLTHAIAAGDRGALTRAAGVGPKLATRVLSELKDKVARIALGPAAARSGGPVVSGAASAPAAASGLTADAVSALVNLGYNPSQALEAVAIVARRDGEDAALETLIRDALKDLAPRQEGSR